jgi:predicted DNA-binding transcriptional regulator YafY
MMEPNHPTLVDAIQNRLQVCFRYHSENSSVEEPTDRVVEPWIYGSKNGKESLYGYQVSGGDPGIRRYDMRRVKKVELNGEHMENHPDRAGDISKWDNIFAATGVGKDLPVPVGSPMASASI